MTNVTSDMDLTAHFVESCAHPIADAGPDQTAQGGMMVKLDGSNSYTENGHISSYSWSQVDTGGVMVTLSSQSAVKPRFKTPIVGPNGEALIFRLTVTDSKGLESTDTCIVNVVNINEPPIAHAGPNINISGGITVELDGSGSSAPDGMIVSYQWEQIEGPEVALNDSTLARASFLAPVEDSTGVALVFLLTVTDDGGLKSTDTCIVNIGNDTPPNADAGNDQTVIEGKPVMLDASHSTDPDDGIALYRWKQINGPPVTLSDPVSITAATTFMAPVILDDPQVELTFLLTVINNEGLQDTDKMMVIVKDNEINGFPEQAIGLTTTIGNNIALEIDEDKGSIIQLDPVDPDMIMDEENRPYDMPYGLIDIQIKVYKPGDTLDVIVYFSTPAPQGYMWSKYHATKGWYDFNHNAVFNGERTQVTLTFTDGGDEDDDGIANGVIMDPSGLGGPSPLGGGADILAGEGGGGCFISVINKIYLTKSRTLSIFLSR